MTTRQLIFTLLGVLGAAAAQAGCLQTGMLKGVNLAGPEFNPTAVPGTVNKDYVYPSAAEFDYFARLGMNTVRLPFLWERIQPNLLGALDRAELERMRTAHRMAQGHGMCLILDLHSYGAYRGKPITSADVSSTAFYDVWDKLAQAFADADSVAFGLSNEPFTLPIAHWAQIAQQTVLGLRARGARNLILVAGGRWSGLHEWDKRFEGSSNAAAFARFKDPIHRSAIEVHQYADANFSGTGTTCLPPTQFKAMFDAANRWATTHDQQLFMGEFGTPPTAGCLAALDAMLAGMRSGTAWRGWTYWAAGAWWGDYPLSIAPRKGEDAPQISVLKKYL